MHPMMVVGVSEFAHLINVLSSATVNHIIQTPVPTCLNEPRTVDAFLNVSPISTLDPPTPMSRNAQQDPVSEPIDIKVPLPLPPLLCKDIIYSSSILVVLNHRNHVVDLDLTMLSCTVHWARLMLMAAGEMVNGFRDRGRCIVSSEVSHAPSLVRWY